MLHCMRGEREGQLLNQARYEFLVSVCLLVPAVGCLLGCTECEQLLVPPLRVEACSRATW